MSRVKGVSTGRAEEGNRSSFSDKGGSSHTRHDLCLCPVCVHTPVYVCLCLCVPVCLCALYRGQWLGIQSPGTCSAFREPGPPIPAFPDFCLKSASSLVPSKAPRLLPSCWVSELLATLQHSKHSCEETSPAGHHLPLCLRPPCHWSF